jgi:hypothetical protein
MIATNAHKLTFSLIAVTLLFGVLVASSSPTADGAEHSPVAITGGKTTLKPTKQMVRKLKRAKVRVRPTGSATGALRQLVFPVTVGRVGMSEGRLVGRIGHQGSGLRLHSQGNFEIQDLVTLRNPVIGLGGGILDFKVEIEGVTQGAFLKAGRFESQLGGPDTTTRIRAKVRLTRQGARLFRSKLGIRVKPGTAFGVLNVAANQSDDMRTEADLPR